jgi:RNA polymerase sigma-70 factor (ECF subfamily)
MDMDTQTAPSSLDEFVRLRPRLFGIAYRMLGVRADAEDIVQEAWLRWQNGGSVEARTPEAWLVTVVTRLSIDRLRGAMTVREHYVGPWLPEPLVEDTVA